MNKSTNQTPAASASRHTTEPTTLEQLSASVARRTACENALVGLNPEAVPALVTAAERMVAALAQEREQRGIAGDGSSVEAELRAALAALKGGAK